MAILKMLSGRHKLHSKAHYCNIFIEKTSKIEKKIKISKNPLKHVEVLPK